MDFCIEEFYEVLCTECEHEGFVYRKGLEYVYIKDLSCFVYIEGKDIMVREFSHQEPFFAGELGEGFLFTDRNYAFNLINRAMLKLALDQRPGNYALRECQQVFEKLPLNYEYGISYKVEDVIGSVYHIRSLLKAGWEGNLM